MDKDEEILEAFRIAAHKGRKEISSEALILLTDVPEHEIFERLKSLEKYGFVKTTIPSRKPKTLWKLSNGI